MNSPIVKYGALAIVWIVWYAFFYSPLTGKIKANETELSALKIQLSTLKKERARLAKVASRLKAKEGELQRLRQMAVKGDDPQVVASNLQNLVLTYVSNKNIEVLTYRTSSTTRWKWYKVARTTFTFKCNRDNFVELFKFFDVQRKLIRPSRVNIVWVRGRNAHIRVILDIEALFING